MSWSCLGLNPSGGENTAFIDDLVIQSTAGTAAATAPSPVTLYQYDNDGNVTNVTTTYTIDPQGAPAVAAGDANHSTKYLYDNLDRKIAEIDPNPSGLSTASRPLTTYNYDQNGNLASTTDPRGNSTVYTYDECGRVIKTVQEQGLSDGSFESCYLPSAGFQYYPSGTPWQFTAEAGISGNGSGFTSLNPTAPDGSQVAFLQVNSSIMQSVYLDAGTYTISLLAAQRNSQGVADTEEVDTEKIEVLVDGVVVDAVEPVDGNYAFFRTGNFTVSASETHIIEFDGVTPGGDNTAFIDDVAVQQQAIADIAVPDGGFESPGVSVGNFQYTPGLSWTFTPGLAGVRATPAGSPQATLPPPTGPRLRSFNAPAA